MLYSQRQQKFSWKHLKQSEFCSFPLKKEVFDGTNIVLLQQPKR